MKPINLAKIMQLAAVVENRRELIHTTGNGSEERKKAYACVEAARADLEQAASAVTAAIKAAEGRATVRTITAEDIALYLIEVEKTLALKKAYMNGVSVSVDLNAQAFAKAYKYTPESTQFKAEYKNGSWRLTDVYRNSCCTSSNLACTVYLPEAAQKAIINSMKCLNAYGARTK